MYAWYYLLYLIINRTERKKEHPRTPNKYRKYSRRAWDGTIKVWRKQINVFASPNESGSNKTTKAKKGDATCLDEKDIEFLPFDFIDDDVVLPPA